ncbi:T9SS type A sorting domain-containing protein [Fluviicola sp.]|uniref:T9SS type A sorting domain-containing protein n=1 Tax=Fluviicola sp. TaxID=1917219 RepID=UPI0031D97A63
MKHVGIQEACSEDWSKMTPTEKGAFCQQCAKQVLDFSNRSTDEIKRTLLETKGQSVCIRMTLSQEQALNAEFEAWAARNKNQFQHLFFAALLIVFGLSLFSCEDERDRKQISDTQVALARVIEDKQPEEAPKEETTFIPPHPVEVEVVNADPIYEIVQYVEQAPQELAEVEVLPYEGRTYIMGGGYGSVTYINYLENTVPQAEVELDENGVPYPTEYKASVFPNPAVEQTTLEVLSPKKGLTEIDLYDLSGKHIQHLYSGEMPRGTFRNPIDLNGLATGIYLVVIRSADFRETVRILKN